MTFPQVKQRTGIIMTDEEMIQTVRNRRTIDKNQPADIDKGKGNE